MEVLGYKCFKKGLINKYDQQFEVGKIYIATGNIKFGKYDNGYHMAVRLEDTLRYFDALVEDVDICLVKGSGIISEGYDDYFGYYDLYAVEKLEIIKLLTREEIIEIGLNLKFHEQVNRFISGFNLTDEEIKLFEDKYSKYSSILKTIEFYQNVYKLELKKGVVK